MLFQWVPSHARALTSHIARWVDYIFTAFAVVSILVISLIFFRYCLSNSTFTPFSLVEEASYTYISARNFLDFGFLNSYLLQDFSTSANPLDHPYVYNHMPPGPDIVQALVFRAVGGSYDASRFMYACTALVGFVYIYLFAKKLLSRYQLYGAGLSLIIPGAWQVVQLLERQIYSPFGFLCFFPLYNFIMYLDDRKKWRLIASLTVCFFSSLYLEYTLLAAICGCWFGLWITRLIPLNFRLLLLVALSFVAGVLLHLFQNFLFLGGEKFLLELYYTLSNRITGYPTQEELKDFYSSIGVLHHGSRPVVVSSILAQIRWNFNFAGAGQILMIIVSAVFVSVCMYFFERKDNKRILTDLLVMVKFMIWVFCCLFFSIFMFPAFSQEVTVRGSAGAYFLGIGVAALFFFGLEFILNFLQLLLRSIISPEKQPLKLLNFSGNQFVWSRIVTLFTCTLAMYLSFKSEMVFSLNTLKSFSVELNWIKNIDKSNTQFGNLDALNRLNGELFMTNINTPVVGLMSNSVGFGVCGPDSVTPTGEVNLSNCKTLMALRQHYWREQKPRYFVYFSDKRFFPGFADCLPDNTFVGQSRLKSSCMDIMLDRLDKNFDLVMEAQSFKVFDMSRVKNGIVQ